MSDQKPSWHEQLNQVKDELANKGSNTHEPEAVTPKRPSSPESTSVEKKPLSPFNHITSDLKPAKPRPSDDKLEVNGGRLNFKSVSGDLSIPLSPDVEKAFIDKAMQYQQAIINEKKASTIATFAMALLSGFTALAIGATLIRSCTSKGDVQISP